MNYTAEEIKVADDILSGLAMAGVRTSSKHIQSPIHRILITYAAASILAELTNGFSTCNIATKFILLDFMNIMKKMPIEGLPFSDSLYQKLQKEVTEFQALTEMPTTLAN